MECIQSRNDNVYINTAIVNPSFDPRKGSIEAFYQDARPQNIVDDACQYEINISEFRLPKSNFALKLIDPVLQLSNPTYFDTMPEEIKIEFKGVEYKANLIWIPQINLDVFVDRIPYGSGPNREITAEDIKDKSFYARFESYYSLYNMEGYARILNNAMENIYLQIPLVDKPASYPVFTWRDDKQAFLLHLPIEYIYDSSLPPLIPPAKIYFNVRLMAIFGKTFEVFYGRLRTTNQINNYSLLNTDIHNRPNIKYYDVSNFTAPFTNNVYTFNNNKRCGPNLQSFGGWNRIEIRSNIQLVKAHYVQIQNPTTGNIIGIDSTQDNLLAEFYFVYNDDLEDTEILSYSFPRWQSVANSGALNNISYSINLVDNYGNRIPLRVTFGTQINLKLQLRKVMDNE
tara:strand:+ start:1390 stop:2586 length:1197 start_codon:yes stop_codon:yes gene_type:complete